MAMTVRLGARTERALDAVAKRRKQTRSDVVREAIEQYAASTEATTEDAQPFTQWADVVGVVRLGARDPQKSTGEQFADLLTKKPRARRPR